MIKFYVDDTFRVAKLNGIMKLRLECSSMRSVFMFDNLVLKIDSGGDTAYYQQCEAEAIFYSRLKECDKIHFAKIVQSGYYKDRAYTIQERVFGRECYGHDAEKYSLEEKFGLYDLDHRNVLITDTGRLVVVDYGLSTVWEDCFPC